MLEEGVALVQVVNPSAQTHCIAGLAHLAVDRGDWAAAELLVDEMHRGHRRGRARQRTAQAGPLAFAALYRRAHAGRRRRGSWLREAVRRSSLGMLVHLGPWLAVETRLDLARGRAAARRCGRARAVWLDEARVARALRGRLAGAGRANSPSSSASLDATTMPLGLHASAMTPAELRVLRYLPTHLTFGAIADELFVSRNTVKTQAIAIYRKLGVSSRDAAVAEARRLQTARVTLRAQSFRSQPRTWASWST